METIIQVKKLNKSFESKIKKGFFSSLFKPEYTSKYAVKDISFEVKKGESVAFLGPNGAGKTTTTKMLTGLIYPTSGSINILGYTPVERKKAYLKRIGLVMGNKAGLNWDLTARQSFRLIEQIYGIDPEICKQRIHELTTLLTVQDLLDTQIRRLSLGERMKLELIGAILHNPDVLFLDEPTIGLDITAKKNIRNFLRSIQKDSQITVILTSHDMDDISHVCDRVIVINKGEKVYDDSIDRLMETYNQYRFVRFSLDSDTQIQTKISQAESIDSANGVTTFKVIKSYMPKLIAEVTAQYDVADIEIISTPLEDIIEDIYTQKH